jgi:hypothetical protein
MSQALTARELFGSGVQEFDPMNLDLTEIRSFSAMIPSDGSIDINVCEVLATRALRMADLCSELLSVATCYVSKMETEKKRCYSQAALVKATAAGIKTDKSRAWFGESDSDFIAASNKYSEGLAFVKFISSKYDSAVRLHYNCKKMLERNYSHEQASGFNCSTDKVIEQEPQQNTNTWGPAEQEHSSDSVDLVNDDTPADDFGSEW